MITFKNIESVISFIDNATFEAVVRKNKVYNKRGELVAAVEIKKGENNIMKANELKSTDLMVGDWVMSFGAPHKVVGIRTDMFEPHIRTDMSDTWYEEGIENLLEPIPLTPEILEKNGFNDSTFEAQKRERFVVLCKEY